MSDDVRYENAGLTALASGVVLSPFTRTRRLLADIQPGMPPTLAPP